MQEHIVHIVPKWYHFIRAFILCEALNKKENTVLKAISPGKLIEVILPSVLLGRREYKVLPVRLIR